LGSTARCWWDTFKIELTKKMAVLCHSTFTFEDLNEHTGLVVSVGSESLSLLGWDSGVSGDQNSHDTTCSFDTLGEGNDVKKK
jgi:hypothetical protein